MTNDIARTIEAIEAAALEPSGFFIGFWDETEERYVRVQGVTPDDLKARAADYKRIADENAKMREALEHYAHSGNWGTTNPEYNHADLYIGNSMRDGQRIARAALDSISKGTEGE